MAETETTEKKQPDDVPDEEKPEVEDQSKEHNLIILKIAGTNNVRLTADAICHYIAKGRAVEIQAMGAGAVNQAIKGFATAQNYLIRDKIHIVLDVFFRNIMIGRPEEEREKTLMVFKLLILKKPLVFPIR